jgi:hypothetical protein
MRLVVLLLLGSTMAMGCADEAKRAYESRSANMAPVAPAQNGDAASLLAGGAPIAPGTLPNDKALQRKIIYTVSLDLAVTQFDGVQAHVEGLVKKHPGAYVAEATLSGAKGSRRSGQWTIRVPQETYDTFTAELRALGEVRDEKKHSDEVTEEFYDLQARIKNKKETEKRILKIQEERTGGLDQVLTAEREIARVREEIERLEGQLNRLDNLTSLTTIKLSVSEAITFHGEELAFTARLGGAWNDGIRSLRDFGQGLAIFLAAITPWLPVWLVIGFVVRLIWRRLFPRRARPAVPPLPPAAPAL